jgi:hypothetical protein
LTIPLLPRPLEDDTAIEPDAATAAAAAGRLEELKTPTGRTEVGRTGDKRRDDEVEGDVDVVGKEVNGKGENRLRMACNRLLVLLNRDI